MLGNEAPMALRSGDQQCVAEMPGNHQHRVEQVGGGSGLALALQSTLVSQAFTWNINRVPTRVDCPHM